MWLKMWRNIDDLTWRDGYTVLKRSLTGELDVWAPSCGGVDLCVTPMHVEYVTYFVLAGLSFVPASTWWDLWVVDVVVCSLLRRSDRLLRSAQVTEIYLGGRGCFLPSLLSFFFRFLSLLSLFPLFLRLKVASEIQLRGLESAVSSPLEGDDICSHQPRLQFNAFLCI